MKKSMNQLRAEFRKDKIEATRQAFIFARSHYEARYIVDGYIELIGEKDTPNDVAFERIDAIIKEFVPKHVFSSEDASPIRKLLFVTCVVFYFNFRDEFPEHEDAEEKLQVFVDYTLISNALERI